MKDTHGISNVFLSIAGEQISVDLLNAIEKGKVRHDPFSEVLQEKTTGILIKCTKPTGTSIFDERHHLDDFERTVNECWLTLRVQGKGAYSKRYTASMETLKT